MVTTDVAQLSRECNAWRETLRSDRASVSELDTRLQDLAGKQSTEDVLIAIDHFHNQFYIQQLNIHDLKHAIRSHQVQIDSEMKSHHGQVNDDTINDHERLYDNFQQLGHTLKDLKDDFADFVERNR